MIVLLLGAPIQNPKMIAALKMKSLGFWFFSSVLFSKLRSGQKYAMLTAQSSSCIKQGSEHVGERSSNVLRCSHPTSYDYMLKETMYVNQPNLEANIHTFDFFRFAFIQTVQ